MKERPFGVGLQGQAPNHLKRLGTKAPVVRVEEKASKRCQVRIKKVSDKRTTASVEKLDGRCRNWGLVSVPRQAQGKPVYGLSGIRRRGGTSLIRALLRNVGTFAAMRTENPQVEDPRGRKYGCAAKGRIIP
jgi:hypothetical protein